MCTYIFCETISSQFNDIFPEIQVKSTAITLSLVQKTAFFPNKHFILYLCKPVHVGWCQPTISWTISDEMHWDWSTGPVTMPTMHRESLHRLLQQVPPLSGHSPCPNPAPPRHPTAQNTDSVSHRGTQLEESSHGGNRSEQPPWFQTHDRQGKSNPFCLWNAQTPSVHTSPRKPDLWFHNHSWTCC